MESFHGVITPPVSPVIIRAKRLALKTFHGVLTPFVSPVTLGAMRLVSDY